MNNWRSAFALLLVAALSFGLIVSSKAAFAHNFSSDESASFLAKVKEIPVEAHAIAADIGNSTLVKWHASKIAMYWNSSDTAQMAERNQLLSKEIPDTIANITAEASKATPNNSTISQLVSNLDGYMSESVSARVDSAKLQNLTVGALALKSVLDEVMNDYGNATTASGDMSSTSGMSGSMSGMSSNATVPITNQAAYESAEGMMTAAKAMWVDLKGKTPSNASSSAMAKLNIGIDDLKAVVDQKQSMDQFLLILHGTIHPNLETAYNLQLGAMTGMNMGGNGGSNTNSTGSMMSTAEQKRLDYVKETGMQRHSEHIAAHLPTAGSYMANMNYALSVNGTGTSISLEMSTFQSSGTIVQLDITSGSVKTAGGTMSVAGGYAYYLPEQHKFIAFGYMPQSDSMGMTMGVQLLQIRATADGKLPTSSADGPLNITLVDPSRAGPGMPIDGTGQVSLS